MMFVIKGVVNLSNDEVGELAFVSYQGTAGDYRFSFFFNKEEIMSDFRMEYSEVLGVLDNKVRKEIMSYDVNTYLRVTEDSFEIVDLNLYTEDDTNSIVVDKDSVAECSYIHRRVAVHKFSLPCLDLAVRAKSHQKQYQMRGIKLAFHLALENPIKYNEVDLIPLECYYADYEAMADIVNLDYTIQDYTQPLKSVVELSEDHLEEDQEEDLDYEEEEIEDEDEVEMDLDEDEEEEEVNHVEMKIGGTTIKFPKLEELQDTPIRKKKSVEPPVEEQPVEEPPVEEEKPKTTKKTTKKTSPKKTTKKEKTSPTQPRTKDGKFAPKK